MSANLFRHFKVEWLFFSTASLLFAVLFAYHVFFRYDTLTSQEKEQLSHSAASSSAVISRQLENINLTLDNIRTAFTPGWKQNDDMAQFYRERLNILATILPNIQAISILDKTGQAIASSSALVLQQSFAFRDYFRTARDQPALDTLYVSAPFKGIYGDWLIGLSKAIIDQNGEFAGIALILLNADEYTQTLDTFRPSPQAWAALAHIDGVLFAWEPHDLNVTGKNLNQPGSLFSRHLDSGLIASSYADTVTASNEFSWVAIRTINPPELNMDHPLILAVGLNLNDVHTTLQKDLIFIVLIYAMMNLVGGTALVFSQRSRRAATFAMQQAEMRTQVLSQQLSSFFDLTPSLMLLTDREARYRNLNPALQNALGYTKEDFHDTSLLNFVHPDDQPKIRAVIEHLQEGQHQTSLLRFRKKSGGYLHLEASFVIQNNLFFIAALDVTERETEKVRLHTLAYHDRLTGLPNRALFLENLNHVIQASAHHTQLSALLFIDLDGFKLINDQYGHDAGDIVLKTIAQRLKSVVRHTDTVARLGGDEFVMILHHIEHTEDATLIAEKALFTMGECITLDTGDRVEVGASIGIAIWPDHGKTSDDLLNAADRAMYQSKGKGKHTFTLACATLEQKT